MDKRKVRILLQKISTILRTSSAELTYDEIHYSTSKSVYNTIINIQDLNKLVKQLQKELNND
jgi:hypothetical protein